MLGFYGNIARNKNFEQGFLYKKDERMYSLHGSRESAANVMCRQIPVGFYRVLATDSAFCDIKNSYFVCEMVTGKWMIVVNGYF